MEVWNWDTETKIKVQGLKAALSSFQTLAIFIVTRNVLDEVKILAAKLQKCDQDIYDAYTMVHDSINSLKVLRSTIGTTFTYWYQEVLQLAETISVTETIPRKMTLMRNRTNTPSGSPQEHYKWAMAIPLLDSFITQLEERFAGEENHGHILLSLIPSLFLSKSSSEAMSEEVPVMLTLFLIFWW